MDKNQKLDTIWSLLRVALGFIFFWAFIDKVFGLGFATTQDKSWLDGVSPTTGFLKFAVHGPLASFFNGLAGNPLIDWLFMLGLLGIGLSLLFGIGLRIAGYSGAFLVFLMYLSLFPSENNPILDEHIIYLFIFLAFATGEIGHRFSLYHWWKQTELVKKYPVLK